MTVYIKKTVGQVFGCIMKRFGMEWTGPLPAKSAHIVVLWILKLRQEGVNSNGGTFFMKFLCTKSKEIFDFF